GNRGIGSRTNVSKISRSNKNLDVETWHATLTLTLIHNASGLSTLLPAIPRDGWSPYFMGRIQKKATGRRVETSNLKMAHGFVAAKPAGTNGFMHRNFFLISVMKRIHGCKQ